MMPTWRARRPVGVTGLSTTGLVFGTAPLGSMVETFGYGVPTTTALATIAATLHSPIRTIDTAPLYGAGESETRIGLVLAVAGGLPRDMLLMTKVGYQPAPFDYTATAVRRSAEASLARLGLTSLPLVHIHDVENSSFERVMGQAGALAGLRRLQVEGLVGHIGVCGGPPDLLHRYVITGEFESVITHNLYTLLNQTARPLLVAAAKRGLAVFNAAPFASGLLAKGAASTGRYMYQPPTPLQRERARRLAACCAEFEAPLAAAALQHSLRHPAISATIVGYTRPERIDQLIELAEWPLPPALWPALGALMDEFNRLDGVPD
jgi:D-threo-aldose 1-dehydrogenase